MDDKKLLALAKKNMAKSIAPKKKVRPTYDDTLPPPPPETADEDEERRRFFKEMKRREF